jgi:hypothetical protein
MFRDLAKGRFGGREDAGEYRLDGKIKDRGNREVGSRY